MRIAAIIVAATLAIGPQGAPPRGSNPLGLQNAEARAHYDAGMKAAGAKDYDAAERELETAYAIEPNRQLLYALGQLARLSGDCTKAVERFEAYLATDPPATAVEDTEKLIERCRPLVEEPEPEPVPPPRPEPEPPPIVPPTDRQTVPPGPDILGITLTAVGGTLTGVGLGVFGGAFSQQERAQNEPDVAAFEASVRRARAMYWSGIGLASVGAALVIGGIVRLALVKRRRHGSTARR
jgi:tetratricopeptide (TPR) repeat protein